MNRITKQERSEINARAEQLYRQGMRTDTIIATLQRKFGISKQRARSAALRAVRKARHPRRTQ